MNKVYICGKVTGEITEEVTLKFSFAETLLTFNNYDPVNPITLVTEDTKWVDAMKLCLKAMLDCTHIYLIDDWRQSRGARIEYLLAKQLKLIRIKQEDLCLI